MELESMFTEQKWNILKCLSKKELSPLQLSEKLDTTMANISQQLKLLEAVNLVKKAKIRNRDRGKPRTLFSLSSDYAYLIPMMGNFADKRLLEVTDHHRAILRIWFLKNKNIQYDVERLYWRLHDHKKHIDVILVDEGKSKVIVVSDNKEVAREAKSKSLDVDVISPTIFSTKKSRLLKEDVAIIYDAHRTTITTGGDAPTK